MKRHVNVTVCCFPCVIPNSQAKIEETFADVKLSFNPATWHSSRYASLQMSSTSQTKNSATDWLPDHSILKKKATASSTEVLPLREKTHEIYASHAGEKEQKLKHCASRASTMHLYETHDDIPFFFNR
ncbi:hypothetical protein BCR33DRAFT_721488, partial [Rhizoclosmatium globosum]